MLLQSAVTVAALQATDVRLLIQLLGALLGSLVVFSLPAFVHLHSAAAASATRLATACYSAMVAYGVVASVLGTIACVIQEVSRLAGAPAAVSG